jgi:hypothetical protein
MNRYIAPIAVALTFALATAATAAPKPSFDAAKFFSELARNGN